MADPILPDVVKAMVVFQHPSGLPEDRFVNGFYFRMDGIGTHDVKHNEIKTALEAFYGGVTGAGNTLAAFMPASHVSFADVRTYWLGEEPPRTPIVSEMTLPAFGSGAALPSEVAACLSYVTERKGPRGRGRIYLGPFVTTVSQVEGGWARPSTTFRQAVADRAIDLMNTSHEITWLGLSRMDGMTYVVTGGHVDDAFDTQRRRGAAATARVGWGSETPPV